MARLLTARPASPRRRPAAVEESIVHAVFDLANHLTRGGERLAKQAGLTTQQWIVLLQIAGDPNFPGEPRRRRHAVLPSEIAAARGVSRATVSVVVADLQRRGLVELQADQADGRRRRLRITVAGEQVLREVEPVRRRANRRLFAPLDAAERAELLRLLAVCLTSMEQLGRGTGERGVER